MIKLQGHIDKFWKNVSEFGESFVEKVKYIHKEQYKLGKARTNHEILY